MKGKCIFPEKILKMKEQQVMLFIGYAFDINSYVDKNCFIVTGVSLLVPCSCQDDTPVPTDDTLS